MEPRVTRPSRITSLYTRTTVLIGSAKPIPCDPPLWVAIMVLTPITSPLIFSSGPPLLPGLIAASVWMKCWNCSADAGAVVALMMPNGDRSFQAKRRADRHRPVAHLNAVGIGDRHRRQRTLTCRS